MAINRHYQTIELWLKLLPKKIFINLFSTCLNMLIRTESNKNEYSQFYLNLCWKKGVYYSIGLLFRIKLLLVEDISWKFYTILIRD